MASRVFCMLKVCWAICLMASTNSFSCWFVTNSSYAGCPGFSGCLGSISIGRAPRRKDLGGKSQ